MKEELLKEFRNDYVERLKKKQSNAKDLKILMKRKEILENSPIVRDYIQLNSQIELLINESFDKDDIYLTTLMDFEDKGLMSETNEIYVYNGTFYTEDHIVKRVGRDNPVGEFDKYIDLESMDELEIPVEDRLAFEASHKVVPLGNMEPTKFLLYKLRNQFIEDALYEGQEVACNKVLSRNKKNL